MEQIPPRKVKTIRFKPFYFIVLMCICVCILLVVLIPQRMRIRSAQDALEDKQNALTEIKREYEQERKNLDYMRTDEYKLEQGLLKYGWHYPSDQLISDPDSVDVAP